MVSLNEIKERCAQVYQEAERLLIEVGYREMGQICIVSPGDTVESRTLYYFLMEYLKSLDTASVCMDQLLAAKTEQGVIRKNEDGDYVLNGRTIEAGDILQVFDEEQGIWRMALVEDDFRCNPPTISLKDMPDLELEGLEVRHAVTDYS